MTVSRPPSLGVQLYGVRHHLADQTRSTLKRLAAMGYTHVEPCDILSDPTELRAAMDAAGLRASTAHVHFGTSDVTRVAAAAAAVGVGTAILPSVDAGRFSGRAEVEGLVHDLRALADRAAEHGLRVGYHNHDFEFAARIGGVSAWNVFADLLDGHIDLELDTYWASMGGGDVFSLLPEYGERIRFLHVKNAPPEDGDPPPKGVDITGRMEEVMSLVGPAVELAIVEIVTDLDLFGQLADDARFFSRTVAR